MPVDAHRFLRGSKDFTKSVLSIGWTTKSDALNRYGIKYEMHHIEEMLNVIKSEGVTQNITFPVRAGMAAISFEEITNLTNSLPNSTLTIWSSVMDFVDVEKLRQLIFFIGLDRVYIDVPQELKDMLHLDQCRV